ncbi:MAG TPA: hypothetical protein VFV65_02890 [Gemmatimonadales bacterium]|nr:hypothetical protein [Gemmatimonadales bacterium]
MTRIVIACLAVLGAGPLSAQVPALVGTWRVAFPAGSSIENGVATPIMGGGVLTIEATADSLIGTLVRDPIEGMPPRPPARLAAARGPSPAVFVSRTSATVSSNGNEQELVAISTWKLQADGNALRGTVEREIEGLPMGKQPPMEVTGTRQPS